LSSLLRYILYECNAPAVSLCEEIKSLQDYIALEKMRFQGRLEVSLSFTGDIANRTIAPLLFLPFVENSIKHGICESLDKSWISLHLHVEGPTLSFKLINSRDPDTPAPGLDAPPPGRKSPANRHPSGLGLANVQRRLHLLYPGRHNLLLVPEDDTFMVSLTLTSPKYEPEMSLG
jgi:LytS/YehU family sensor histidine kinase